MRGIWVPGYMRVTQCIIGDRLCGYKMLKRVCYNSFHSSCFKEREKERKKIFGDLGKKSIEL